MPLYLALKTRIVLMAPIWTTPRTMNTDAGSNTAWIVIRIEATNQRVNALRLIPAEHCSYQVGDLWQIRVSRK